MTIVESRAVTGGVDARPALHVAAALHDLSEALGVEEFPATPAGHQALLDWLAGFGPVARVGIDTTGSCGAGLTRHLRGAGVMVVEVDRAEQGHDDEPALPLDAIGVARAARSGEGRQLPGDRDPLLEAIDALMVSRGSAENDRAATVELIRALVAAAPADLGLALAHPRTASLVGGAVALRPCPGHPVGYATRVALAELGARAVYLEGQIGRLDELLIPLVAAHAAGLLATFGVKTDGTATLVAVADDEAALS
ncbi:MAG: hypothetical protein ACRD0L_00630 [Acidimicrobiales bacterium]